MDPIRIYDDDENLLIRDGFNLVFFVKKPFYEISSYLEEVLDVWLDILPPELDRWASVGANSGSYKPFNKSTLARCRSILDPEKAKEKNISYFRVHVGSQLNPPYAFQVFGKNKVDSSNSFCCCVQMQFPGDFPDKYKEESLVDFCLNISKLLPYTSGYASLALNYCTTYTEEASEKLFPLAMKHPGLDIFHYATCYDIGSKSRGARWITFPGPENTSLLGGKEAIIKLVDPGVQVFDTENGIAIVAGPMPEAGDVDKQQNLPLIRSVAKAIEQVSFFGDCNIENLLADDGGEIVEENVDHWERRFFD